MKKILTFFAFYCIVHQSSTAQRVTSDTIVNFMDMVAYEAAHPEWFKDCKTCPPRVADRNEGLKNPYMPIPPGATIKYQEKSKVPFANIPDPQPMAPSRPPVQNWLGYVDPGNTIPPDTHGAVGLNHVITATNDYIKIHNKVGGAQISQVSISTFTAVSGTCDPYMVFDPSAQRWIFTSINCSMSTGNPMILMVSNTPDPTGSWRKITFLPQGAPLFLDHPYVGFDATKIVIDARRIGSGLALFLIDKAAMYAGTAITFGSNAQEIDVTSAEGDVPCPITIYDPPFSNVPNPSPGTFYILQGWNGGASAIRLSTVTGTIPNAVWNTSSAVFPTGGTPWGNPPVHNTAEQMIETRLLDCNDDRISCAVLMNGKIWCTQSITFPVGGTPDRIAVQWWQLDATPGASFGNVLQRGRIGGSNAREYRWFPSIAVNKDEDVVIGFTSSSNTTRVNAGYVTRQATTPANTTDDELIFKTGLDRYWKNFGGSRARWGDYSHSSLDPVDNSLWTIQQYAHTGAGTIPPDNNSRYGIWWAQIPATASNNPTFNFSAPSNASVACGSNSASITLQTVSLLGFTTPINLVASGNPAGTTVTYSVNPVVPGNSTVVTLNNMNALSPGSYPVTITGTAGTEVNSVVLTYIVNAGAGPAISAHPSQQTICAGGNTSFSITSAAATGFQWQLSTDGGTNWTNVTNGGVYSNVTTSTLNITGATTGMNNYLYRCIASVQCGSTNSNAALLTVQSAPSISVQPSNSTICGGNSTSFSVTAGGANLTYQWQVSTTGCAGSWANISNAAPYSGVTTATLSINPVTIAMNGYAYRCVVSGSCSPAATSGCGSLTANTPIAIGAQPTGSTICAGSNTVFTVAATGTSPAYQWQESTNGGGAWNNITNGGMYGGANTTTLTLTGVTAGMDGYQYRCNVTGAAPCGLVSSGSGTLTVNTAPAITTQPVAGSTICSAQNTSYSVVANGTALTYQWQVSTAGAGGPWNNITNGGVYAGATTASLTITAATVSMNSYQYRCVISGTCAPAATSTAAILTVHTPVSITTAPSNATICATGTTGFSMSAAGTSPTYQWQESTNGGTSWNNITNGGIYSGATTATLTLTGVTPVMNNYQYRNAVTGTAPCGTVNSPGATLTVSPRPTVTLTASPYTKLFPGYSTVITASVTPPTGFTTVWTRNGTPISVTGNSKTVTVNELGLYKVVATIGTCTSEDALITISDSASNKLWIYPSPTFDGQFTVAYHNPGGSTTQGITIYDRNGRRVFNSTFPVNQAYQLHKIDLRRNSAGVYYVVLRDANGKKVKTGEVLVR